MIWWYLVALFGVSELCFGGLGFGLPGCDLWVYVGAVGICLVLFLVVWFKCCGVLGIYVECFQDCVWLH